MVRRRWCGHPLGQRRRRRGRLLLDLRERLVEVNQDVVDVLDAHGEADELRRQTRLDLLLVGELRVRRGGRVDRERLRVADVGDVGEELERVDHLLARFAAALQADDDEGAALALQVLLLQLVHRVAAEARITHPRDLGVLRQVRRGLHRVLAVLLHAHRQRLDALERHPGVVRAHAAAQVPERHRPHPQDVRERREHLRKVDAPPQAAVRRVGLREGRVLARGPVEFAAVDDDAADGRAVAARPLRERVADDVGAVLEGLAEVGRRERVVDDERQTEGMRLVRDGLDVGDV
mmetsp:Transcript_25022/g.75241  ORF Transcript_25022/g.75241 Transcript_25022/m.75241 type:complete len:292 (-) Transcript_25022:1678-2553(-)